MQHRTCLMRMLLRERRGEIKDERSAMNHVLTLTHSGCYPAIQRDVEEFSEKKERMRGWISIDQDQSEPVINSFSSLTEIFCLAIGQSSVDVSNAKNVAPCDECETFFSCIRRLVYLTLFDQLRWRILRDHIPQFHCLGCRWIRCVIPMQQRLKWRSTRLYIPDQYWRMLWDVIWNRWPLFKN